jgi:hypothetical protein
MDEDAEVANQAVELTMLTGDSAYSKMQFNRCMSFEARSSLPNRTPDSQTWRCMDDASSDSSLSDSAWRNQSFEPFEVETQATEVKFLRGQLTKKVRQSNHSAVAECVVLKKEERGSYICVCVATYAPL